MMDVRDGKCLSLLGNPGLLNFLLSAPGAQFEHSLLAGGAPSPFQKWLSLEWLRDSIQPRITSWFKPGSQRVFLERQRLLNY